MQLDYNKFVKMGIIRKTKSVEALLDVFRKSEGSVSVVYLVEHLKKKMNKTTVYRILERMEQDGIVHSFNDRNGLRWYAKCKGCSSENHLDRHPHFQCNGCGAMECLALDIAIPAVSNYQIDAAEIILTGTCSKCLS